VHEFVRDSVGVLYCGVRLQWKSCNVVVVRGRRMFTMPCHPSFHSCRVPRLSLTLTLTVIPSSVPPPPPVQMQETTSSVEGNGVPTTVVGAVNTTTDTDGPMRRGSNQRSSSTSPTERPGRRQSSAQYEHAPASMILTTLATHVHEFPGLAEDVRKVGTPCTLCSDFLPSACPPRLCSLASATTRGHTYPHPHPHNTRRDTHTHTHTCAHVHTSAH
jgi:hypothetical protein